MNTLDTLNTAPKVIDLFQLDALQQSLPWEAHATLGREGTQIKSLYRCEETGQHVALVYCHPGAQAQEHIHHGHETFLVLDGRFEDDHGSYGKGQLVVFPPGSRHSWRSPEGAVIYVVWGGRVTKQATPREEREEHYNFRHLV